MIYRIEPEIFEQYPYFYRGVVVASGVNNTAPANEALEQLFKRRIKDIEEDASLAEDHPRIKAWSDIYKDFPLKGASRIRPSVLSLVRRIKAGKGSDIPFISPLVCISNLISLLHLVPSGLIDAEKVSGNLVLGYSQGIETFEPIGSDEVLSPQLGEIIYYDNGSNVVMCRAWNSRGGKATYILPSTKIAVIDVDGLLTVITESEVQEATKYVASLVHEYCGAMTNICFLSKNNQMFEFKIQ